MHKNKPDWTKLITPEMAEVVAHIRQWNEEHPRHQQLSPGLHG